MRFDGDDFDSAYRELEQRYYAAQSPEFTASGPVTTEWIIALNRSDLDRIFADIVTPDFRVESQSRSVFGDRSAAQVRASLEELTAMVASAHTWNSVVCWLSPQCCVSRMEREAVGLQGERFTWTRVYVSKVRGGRLTSLCEFEPENEDDAFAYAKELTGPG